MTRTKPSIRWPLELVVGALVLVASGTALAQADPAMDERGNLREMPFELDVPVTRTEVRRVGEDLHFVNYSPMGYEEALQHFRAAHADRRELAPGWRLRGLGFDVGADTWAFTLAYGSQFYRIEVRPDLETGGAIIILVSRGRDFGYQPNLQTVMPYRAADVGPIEVPW